MSKKNKKTREGSTGIDVETLVVAGGALLSACSMLKPLFDITGEEEEW